MYEHNAVGYWSGLALCLTKSEAVEHAVLRQLLFLIFDQKHRLFLKGTHNQCFEQKC